MQTQDATVPASERIINRVWQPAVIVLGIGLTAAWAGILGYGLGVLIELVI